MQDSGQRNFVKESATRTSGVERKNVFKAVIRHLLKFYKKNRGFIPLKLHCTQETVTYYDKTYKLIKENADRNKSGVTKDYKKTVNILASNPMLLPLLCMSLESMYDLYNSGKTRLKEKNKKSYITAIGDMLETARKWLYSSQPYPSTFAGMFPKTSP